MKQTLKNLVLLFLLNLMLAQCADVTQTTTNDGSTTDVSDDVATNTAAVNEIVTADTLEQLYEVLNRIGDDIDDNTGVILGDNRLTAYVDSNNANDLFTVELSSEEDCVEGGSKTLTGQLDYNNDSDGSSGSITGSFTITYDDCQDTVTLNPEDQDCGATPTINGDMETTLEVTYGFVGTNDSSSLDYFLESETDSAGVLDITAGSEASDQTYSYTHELSDNTTRTNLSGTVEFGGRSYSVTEVSEFILSSTSDVVCVE